MYRIVTLALVALAAGAGLADEAYGQQTRARAPITATPATSPAAATAVEASTPEVLRARLDSLRPLVAEAREALRAREARMEEQKRRAAAMETPMDTLRVGQVTVLTPTDEAGATEELFSRVWDEHFEGLGESPALLRSTFVFHWSDEPKAIHVDGEALRLVHDRWTRGTRLDDRVREAIGARMSRDLEVGTTRVGSWLRANPFHAEPMGVVYRKVATTHSRATRACLAGDAQACGSALGLGTERTAAQLRAWYTPEERRALVAGAVPQNRLWGPARARCLDEGVGCDEVLVSYPYREWAPLGADVRRSLVVYALEQGGTGAWSRLLEDPEATPSEALAHAAGMPLGDLMAGWQARLVAHRPDTFEGLVPRSGLTLLWTLFFAALAVRSTRWRLG